MGIFAPMTTYEDLIKEKEIECRKILNRYNVDKNCQEKMVKLLTEAYVMARRETLRSITLDKFIEKEFSFTDEEKVKKYLKAIASIDVK